jgi:putative transposase
MVDALALLLGVLAATPRTRRDLVTENLLLRHQLAVLSRPTRRRPRPARPDKVLWVLARQLVSGWRRHLVLVTPDTVVRWHRRGWRLLRRWRSRATGGRPRLSGVSRGLIHSMSRDSRLWGTQRIRSELLKLGVVASNAPSAATAGGVRIARRPRRGALCSPTTGRASGRPTCSPSRP